MVNYSAPLSRAPDVAEYKVRLGNTGIAAKPISVLVSALVLSVRFARSQVKAARTRGESETTQRLLLGPYTLSSFHTPYGNTSLTVATAIHYLIAVDKSSKASLTVSLILPSFIIWSANAIVP